MDQMELIQYRRINRRRCSMSLEDEFWEDHHKDCPWHDERNQTCEGQVEYNGHVNDPRYAKCRQYNCPIFFWVSAMKELKGV